MIKVEQPKFDSKKYIERQKKLIEDFNEGKITSKERFSLAEQTKERKEVYKLAYKIKELIEKHNIPMTFSFCDHNVQSLLVFQDEIFRICNEQIGSTGEWS